MTPQLRYPLPRQFWGAPHSSSEAPVELIPLARGTSFHTFYGLSALWSHWPHSLAWASWDHLLETSVPTTLAQTLHLGEPE